MIGCLRYGTGFEALRERDDHVRSHDRPSKCPERGCFYAEAGFANERTLNQHTTQCHTDPASNRFVFPNFRKSPPAMDERNKFREAIRREDLDLLRDMIHTNGSLRGQLSPGSYTGLGYAAFHGKLKSIRCLLECGCNIGAVSDRGTALHAACNSRQAGVVQFLLSNSTSEDLKRKNKEGRTPLANAVRKGYEEAVRLILKHGVGADVNAKDNTGRTALSWAASSLVWGRALIKTLLEQDGVDVDVKDAEGRTPLSWAASEGDPESVRLFLECGEEVDVNSKDNKGRTPLSWAASRTRGLESPSAVKLLLEQDRVDVDAKDDDGRTPLSWAASESFLEVVRLFLEYGEEVDVNSKDNKGRTPLSWAASWWTRGLASSPVVQVLLEQDKVDVDTKDDDGRTPLSWAASEGQAGTVRLFLRHGLGVAVNSKDKGDRTPLSWALAREDSQKEQVVKILVQNGGITGVL